MTENKDYTKVCWSCGKETMQPEQTFYRCSKCGATWCEVNELRGPTVEPGNVIIATTGGPIKVRAQHPTLGVARRASRARIDYHTW